MKLDGITKGMKKYIYIKVCKDPRTAFWATPMSCGQGESKTSKGKKEWETNEQKEWPGEYRVTENKWGVFLEVKNNQLY